MNETTRLVLKILATVALVVIVYMAFSYLAAAVIAHTADVFEWSDVLVPVLLGFVAEYRDITLLVKSIRGGKD